jgi:GH43 family beta-xylosidase
MPAGSKIASSVLWMVWALIGAGAPVVLANGVFTNPLLDSGADPWVIYDRGYYYYTHTMGDRLQIWKTKDITQLRHAATKVVWRAPATGPNSASIWAPELHRQNGKWYLYFTGADRAHDDDDHRHQFVLENAAADP